MIKAYLKHSIGALPLAVRLTPPSPGGRGPLIRPPAQQGKTVSGVVKDYSTQASAFLLDNPETGTNSTVT